MSDEVKVNTKNLDHLIKALKENNISAKVGILGTKATRSDSSGRTNATIGAYHEFGTHNIPMRSFLRQPISELLGKRLENSDAFDKDVLAEVVRQGSVLEWVKKIAITAEAIVMEAFATKGFGKWAPWKSSSYSNQGGTLLVDTGQLRDSISSEVK